MQFTLQGIAPFLHWLTLGILCIFPILAAFVIYKLGSLPGSVARSRRHPQADAINICGWMGILTLVLWPLALVWAHMKPAGLAGEVASDETLSAQARLQKLSQRLAAVERQMKSGPGATP